MNRKIKSFSGQLKRSFIVVVIIPVLVLGAFIFYSSFQFIEKQMVNESMNIVKQSNMDIENRFEACNDSLRYLAANNDLRNFLLINREDYLDISRLSKNISQLIYNVFMLNKYYKSLTIYTDKEFYVLKNFIKVSSEVENEEWYKNVVKSEGSYLWTEGNKIFMGITIMAAYPTSPIGVIKVEIKNDMVLDSFHIFENIPIKIEVKNNNDIFYKYIDSQWNENPRLSTEYDLGIGDLKILYQIDKNHYKDYIGIRLGIPILVVFIVLILVWFLINYFTKRLVKDLFILVEKIEEVQKGNLDVSISLSETTEINILAISIQNLLNKIKQLIREVYTKEIERQNLELDLLQSKMNPHFLYNNLSAINWIALENDQEKICIIATELANFYRTALNKGKNIDKLSIEIENVKAYINLQLISHENSFSVKYDVDEDLLKKEVPLFILQPLVENAIEHGIDQLWDKMGKIEISVKKDEEWLQMKVYDNGKGLYAKIGNSELPEEKFGYGTSNVQKRIKLLYGSESGLKIQADKFGTTVTIRFRFDQLKKLI